MKKKLYINSRPTKLDKVKMIGANLLQAEDDYNKSNAERKQVIEPILNQLRISYQNYYKCYKQSLN